MATNTPVYWVGQNGNLYYKSPQTDSSGARSTSDLGAAKNFSLTGTGFNAASAAPGTNNPFTNANRIADPTVPTGGGTTGGTGTNMTALLNQIHDQSNNIVNSGTNSFSNSATGYQTQANNLLGALQTGQQNVNNEVKNTELNKIQSMRSLMAQVGQGLHSGAVQLASGNALDSSAAGALARAFSNYQTQQRGTIGQTEQNSLSQAQNDQNTVSQQQNMGLAQLQQMRNDVSTQVGNDVANQLQNLDYQANNAGISGQVDIQGLKQQVVNGGLARLAQIDQWLQGQLSGLQPMSVNDAGAQAYQQLQQGASNAGNGGLFDTGASMTPTGQQMPGAADSLLPLFLRPSRQTAA